MSAAATGSANFRRPPAVKNKAARRGDVPDGFSFEVRADWGYCPRKSYRGGGALQSRAGVKLKRQP